MPKCNRKSQIVNPPMQSQIVNRKIANEKRICYNAGMERTRQIMHGVTDFARRGDVALLEEI